MDCQSVFGRAASNFRQDWQQKSLDCICFQTKYLRYALSFEKYNKLLTVFCIILTRVTLPPFSLSTPTLEFDIAPEELYEKSWTGTMLFSMDFSKLIKPSISFHKQTESTLNTHTLSTHCVLSVDQAFFFVKANTCSGTILKETEYTWYIFRQCYKGDNFCYFLFVLLHMSFLLKGDLLFSEGTQINSERVTSSDSLTIPLKRHGVNSFFNGINSFL